MSLFTPIYKGNALILGNPASSVGIVTLWTLKAKAAARLDPSDYAAIGQLYSPTQGLDYLVRNLLANPSIRYLVVAGHDLSGSGRALRDFFERGVEEGQTSLGAPCWRVRSEVESFVDPDISREAIELLRQHVRLVVCAERDNLRDLVGRLPPDPGQPLYTEPMLFHKREPEVQTGVGENAVYVVRGETVAETWVQILHIIWSFGRVSDTHYDSRQKEILDLVSVVTAEDPNSLFVPDYLPCTPAQLEVYFPTVLTADPPHLSDGVTRQEVRYTYGQRLRSYFGVDQVEDVIAKLARERDSRSAAASLWDPRTDHRLGGSPCLNHLWFRIVGDALNLTSVIRSNDMYKAWPENAFALRKLQAIVRGEVARRAGGGGEVCGRGDPAPTPLRLGDLVIVSESAHIYDDDWDATEHVLARHYDELAARIRERRDPRGNYLVELDGDRIRVERLAPSGEHVKHYYGKTAGAIMRQIDHDTAVSSVEHGLYLGSELQKAELALRYPDLFEYVQDRPLARRGPAALPTEATTSRSNRLVAG